MLSFDPDDSHRLAQARAIAAGQHGVVEHDQLEELGIPAQTVYGWAQEGGVLVRVHQGVYTFDSTPLLFPARARAALLSVPVDHVTARETAAVLGDLADPDDGPIHLLTTRRTAADRDGVVARRTDRLDRVDLRTTSDGIPYTSPARTMLDLAASRSAAQVDRVLDRAMKYGHFEPHAVYRLIDDTGLRGRKALKAAVDRLNETCGRNRSELERRLIALVLGSSLPSPLVNSIVLGEEVDLRWDWLIVEADGRQWHTSPAQIAADIAKQAKLEAAGFYVARVDWAATNYRPDATLARVSRLHATRSAQPNARG